VNINDAGSIGSSGGEVSIIWNGKRKVGQKTRRKVNRKITAGGKATTTPNGEGGRGNGNPRLCGLVERHGCLCSNLCRIYLNGGGGGIANGGFNVGVNVIGTITAGGLGAVTITGKGGDLFGTGVANYGIWNEGKVTSSGGDISITGTGGGGSSAGQSNQNNTG